MTHPDRATMRMDATKHPYAKPQPFGMIADIFTPGALDLDADEQSWVPQAEGVWFRPLVLCVSQGYYVNLLRVRNSGVLSRHRHAGPVHAITLRGRWHYLEHDWEAAPGSYAFEPAGETHTLVVPDDVDEMITLFHVTGGYVYVDTEGRALGYEDVFTKLEATRAHFEAIGLGAGQVESLMR
jgi:2,4'-dihydroxyacetophenone dioxygenase